MVIIPPHLLADWLFCQNLYYGNAGDSMYSHNGLPFSTFDVDNDNRSTSIYQQDLSRPNLDSIFPQKNLTDRLHKDLVTEFELKYISGMESLQREAVPDCTRWTLLWLPP